MNEDIFEKEFWQKIIVAIIVGLIMAFPIMWCWNYSIVFIFNLPEITWGRAWCLAFLFNQFIRSIK